MNEDYELEVPKNLPAKIDAWPVGLSIDVAYTHGDGRPLYTDEELCERHKITLERFEIIRNIPAFKQEVAQAAKEINQTNGVVIKKAAMQVEHYIDTLVPTWLGDDKQPLQAKVQVMAFLAKIGRLDGSIEKAVMEAEAAKKQSSGPSLIINLTTDPNKPPPFTIENKE